MVFSTNQFRHLYVATAKAAVTESSAVGTIDVKKSGNDSVYFSYMGQGGQVRSDLIKIDNILYAKATNASAMKTPLKSFTVELDSDVNEGKPIKGQDYILKLAYKQFVGLSDEDTYYEYGEVHATSDDASKFYKELAVSLAKNTAKQGLVEIKLVDADGSEEVKSTSKVDDFTGTYTSVLIDEKLQDWVLGTKPLTFVNISEKDIVGVPVKFEGSEVLWANVEQAEVDPVEHADRIVSNGKTIADLEYFCMGERGDIYRNIGWPNVIPTKYMVDPSKEYHTLDIHYAFVGDNENPQKSEKDITIVCDSSATLNTIIGAFNTSTGLNVTQL